MASGSFAFEGFALDLADRRLSRAGEPVDISSRYLDALALLLRERGKLVTKDRFMDEVWQGIPVTDEALTQCIRTLRRQLGDDAARPRFIETVPKHGYRFIAEVEQAGEMHPAPSSRAAGFDWQRFVLLAAAGTAGGGIAGAVGGLLYGFALTSPGPLPETGAASLVTVLVALAAAVGLAGGAGVSLGIAGADVAPGNRWQWSASGGAAGGLVIGALARLLGLDAFHLLLGHAPQDMTGAPEGALLGAAVGFGVWLARQSRSLARGFAFAGAAGAAAGALIPLLGGRLLGGSLDLLARGFPDSRFRLDPLSGLLGETGFGVVSQVVTAAAEGALFALGVAGAILLAGRTARPASQATLRPSTG